MDNFNLESLRVFMVVSRLGSFSRAADYLYLDQSTVSKRIQQLEQQFHQTLFIRTARGVKLTVDGRTFHEHAQRLLDDYQELKAGSALQWGNLRLGIFDNIAAYNYPEWVSKVGKKLALLKIGNAGIELTDLFNQGRLDAIIVNGSLANQITGDFVSRELMTEAFAVLASANTDIDPNVTLRVNDLSGRDLITAPEYCPASQVLLKMRHHFADWQTMDYSDTMVQLVRRTKAVTILPVEMVRYLTKHTDGLVGAPLVDFPSRSITVFSREQRIVNQLVKVLYEKRA